MNRHFLLTALLAGLATSGHAAPSAKSASVEGPRLSQHIRILASDAFEGRGPATEGERKAIGYIEAQYRALGLQPAGDRGGYLQDVPLRRFEVTGPVELSFDLGGKARPLAPLADAVVDTQLPVDHVAIARAPLVFVGYGVDAPERRWNDFKGVDLRGKIAVVLVNDPDFALDPHDPLYGRFDGKAETYYGRWDYKYAEAARHGAVGVLIVHETAPAAYGWNTVKNSWSQPQFDIVRNHPEALHPLMEGWIQRPVAEELFRAAGLDLDAEERRAQREDFRPVELKGASFSAHYRVGVSTIVSHNVIGKLTGTTRPREAVLYGAHWDHLGVGAPDARGDRIYNGARDNASGVAGVLEIARLFAAAPRTARSVYFIAFTGEEKGLLGSEYYATHPVTPLATTVALLNLDGLNLTGPSRDVSLHGMAQSDLDTMIAQYARSEGRAFTPDAHPEAGSYYRADHFSLAKAGVPALTLGPGLDLVNGGTAAGEAAYRDYVTHRYHQPADEWRPDWDYGGAVQDLNLYFRVGRDLAQSDRWLNWLPKSEFRAAREATAAARR
ncbi:MAG TPA: M28 family metallopeptidase [Caulobacteraceae bacterium]|nr:M28 family metallopeptidase [Caulobacteraceae bacterium]